MAMTQTYIGTLVIETCCNCGMPFGMDREYYNKLREDHKIFYCPKGHEQYYSGKSDVEKAKEELLAAKLRIENLHNVMANKNGEIQFLKYSVRAQKSAKTKIMNRVKNGVCPCCNRTFKDLQNHFKTKHPELIQS